MKITPLARSFFDYRSVLAALAAACGSIASAQEVPLHWLDDVPAAPAGVNWGVPWPRGAVKPGQTFTLRGADGKTLPLQTWPMAYWPDGSLKWIGCATVASAGDGNLTIVAGQTATAPAPATTGAPAGTPAATIQITQSAGQVQIDTGKLVCRISSTGPNIVDSLAVDGREVARNGQLVCIQQDGSGDDPTDSPKRTKYLSEVKNVTLEQSGPVRAVVKITGMHRDAQSGREWLPFTVRLYFFAGQTAVRMVHTIVYDGNEQKDFIRGLGVTFEVPFREQVQNRHVRFSGENGGLWAEPIQPMVGRGGRVAFDPDTGTDLFVEQVAGQRVPNNEQLDARVQQLLADWAIWSDFRLLQPNDGGFTIQKRTNPQSTWIQSGAGRRASGLAFVGDVSGGLGVSLKNFWELCPTELEIQNAASPAARLNVWLWSPEAPVMDLRHYDIRAHGLEAAYEDVQPGMSTPYGVARTSDLMLFPTGDVPSKANTVQLAALGAQPPFLASTPEYLHSTGVFGYWSLPDRSTPFKQTIEDQLDGVLNYYLTQPDERHWYGFWTFGDVMHSYDAVRHVWRYDLGGMAWDNTELAAPLWLWYSYLRTGRPDVFRFAENHTRNTSETDVYHLGPMEGLGSRHNVVKWGDGAKEARVSQAAHWRPYYYLTTDERTGDIMREVLVADLAAQKYDPMREAGPPAPGDPKYPARVRAGPDWLAFAGNWMTEWERTGDTKWRDKILTGITSMDAMPYWFRTGQTHLYNPATGQTTNGATLTMGYDPATNKLYPLPDPRTHQPEPGDYNLATIQGGGEVAAELSTLLDDPRWNKIWSQYCRLRTAPAEVLILDKTSGNEGADARYVGGDQGMARLAAFAYLQTKDPAFARAATGAIGRIGTPTIRQVGGPNVLNPVDESTRSDTNGASQSSLNAIEVLALCADQLPTEAPRPGAFGFGGGFGRRGRGAAADNSTAQPRAPAANPSPPAAAASPSATAPATNASAPAPAASPAAPPAGAPNSSTPPAN